MFRAISCTLLLILATAAFAQFDWADNGIPIRQGMHLGWNGAMIYSGNDVALFYYDSHRNGMRDVWGQRLGQNGNRRWGLDGELIAGNVSEQRAPVVATYSDGTILTVWEDYRNGRYRDLYAQRYAADGSPLWLPADGVPVVVTAHDQFDARVAIDENDMAYIVFTDDRESAGGENVRLGAYGQVLTPQGQIRGPMDGILLMDRLTGWNIPIDVAAEARDGYALITASNGVQTDVVLQKILPSGNIAWPEDPAVTSSVQNSIPVMCAVEGGLAIGYTDQSVDPAGEAKLLLIDLNRNPLPGWENGGVIMLGGANTQAVTKLAVTPSGQILAALATYDFDVNQSMLSIACMTRQGSSAHAPVELGLAALHDSPADFAMLGDTVMVTWAARPEDGGASIFAQVITPGGQKLCGTSGHLLWSRADKQLRCDLVGNGSNPARIAIASGRGVVNPESLWTAQLTFSGYLAGTPDLLAGGITYDAFDPRVARIDDESALIVWTDSRDRVWRDVYYQILDRHGAPQFAIQGRQLTDDERTIQTAPAVVADGNHGAFIAWMGDSSGANYALQIQRIDEFGQPAWTTLPRITTEIGFFGEPILIADGLGGVYIFYSFYNMSFVTRTSVVHVTAQGQFDWSGITHEFDGSASRDMSMSQACADGAHGAFVVMLTGPWEDTDIGLFHIALDGTPGSGWSNTGREFGYPGSREQRPLLVQNGGGAVLCFLRENSDLATGSLRAVKVNANGDLPWGATPRALIGEESWLGNYRLVDDLGGGFFLAWQDYRLPDYARVYAARFNASATALWTAAGTRVCTHESEQLGAAITADTRGGAWITWEDQRNSDDYPEIDLYASHLDASGNFATVNGFTWPESGQPMCTLPTYQREATLIPWINGSAFAMWQDQRSSNPGRCCGAGSVGDIFYNTYVQVLSEISLAADKPHNAEIPAQFGIASAYPNPFNPNTTIRFNIDHDGISKLAVYNSLGQQVAMLLDGNVRAGVHELRWDAAELPSGLYFARLETNGLHDVQKLLMIK